MIPSAEAIALALGGRRSGTGWIARCPAHDDGNPSLSVTQRDGRVLVCCRAGCEQREVIAALRARGLWNSVGRRVSSLVTSRSDLRRDAERAAVAESRSRWLAALAVLRGAQADVDLLKSLIRDDPYERDPRTTAALDALGDPYLRELLAEQRLDEIEAADRERREVHRAAA